MLLDPPNTQTLDVMHEQPVLPIAMPPTDVFRKGTLNCATLDPTKENLPIQLPATAQIAATDAVEAATDSSNGGAGGGQGTAAQMVMDTSAAMQLDEAAKPANPSLLSTLLETEVASSTVASATAYAPMPLEAKDASSTVASATSYAPVPLEAKDASATVAPPTSCAPVPPQATDVTETGYSLTLGRFMESYAACMNVRPEDVFHEERLCAEIEVLRGTRDDPKHRVNLAVYGAATGKWTGDQAYKKAREEINKALEFKNSGECDGSQCKHRRTLKHILCNTDVKVVETTHAGNGLVSRFIFNGKFVP